ncbi:hypothetical protein [Neomoorella thermoacetica]|uniref:Uncharacterized protein n=1 Tax=Moorella thermoacetica Y72 TaxID=1325331 RepID=A0A0S6UGF8_NEOTH|nr:hypothetical protein [Moorella thermoacetica]GAF26534.1 hypothetical protein MTY_1874 [Moorella thermoacetica Y72]
MLNKKDLQAPPYRAVKVLPLPTRPGPLAVLTGLVPEKSGATPLDRAIFYILS